MVKVELQFSLVGVSEIYKRELDGEETTAKDTLSYVHKTIVDQFGDRALIIANENELKSSGVYPKNYAAGWFLYNGAELVVVDHGNTMKTAYNNMIESAKKVDWDNEPRKF